MSGPQYFETIPVAELVDRGLARPSIGSCVESTEEHLAQTTVLVVDDEQVIADTLVLILNGKGFQATAAYDGQSALELARKIAPDILISDVMMPGMNGVHLAITVRHSWPACRILLFSGNAASQELLISAHDLGHDFDFLSKPVHPDALLERLSAPKVSQGAA